MELSERAIQTFESEGFINVYEHQDVAGAEYPEYSHQGKVSIFVTDGSIMFNFRGEKKTIVAPRRFDIPSGTVHSAQVGPEGCIMIIAEEIDGDF